MRTLYHILCAHLREDFNAKYYAAFGALMTLCIALNYHFGWAKTLVAMGVSDHNWLVFPLTAAFYAAPYFTTLGLYSFFAKETAFWRDRRFWLYAAFFLLLRTVDFASWTEVWATDGLPAGADRYWLWRTVIAAKSLVFVALPLVLFYIFIEKINQTRYGITRKSAIKVPYHWLALAMLPIIGLAAVSGHFTPYYPIMHPAKLANISFTLPIIALICYEMLYLGTFFIEEWLSRGFAVDGMRPILGKNAILPMVAVYAFIHFSKPMGEAIGAVFGGYILGVLVFRTGNIWGGVWLHIGIAAMMEIGTLLYTMT
jgi:hypothetical protein